MSGVGTCRAKTLTGSGKGDKLDYGYSSPQKRTKSYLNCNESNEFPSNLSQNVRRKSGSLILEDGWIMGPLGLPVRETLEVGHRGTQKAFNQKSPSHQRTSERTESDNDPHHLHSQFPEQEHLSENNPDESSTAVYHRRRSVFDVEVTDEKKEQKAKQMQVNILQMLVLYPYYNLKSHSGIDDYSFTPVVHFFLPSTFSSFIHSFIYLFISFHPPLDRSSLVSINFFTSYLFISCPFKLEQNRALEQQIRDKAAKAAAEKEKMAKEEALEVLMLRRSQIFFFNFFSLQYKFIFNLLSWKMKGSGRGDRKY